MKFLITNPEFKYEVDTIGEIASLYVIIEGVKVFVTLQDGVFIPEEEDFQKIGRLLKSLKKPNKE